MSFAGIVAYQSILRLLTEDNAYARSSFSFNPVIELSCGLYRDRDSINEIHVYRAYRFSNWSRQLGTFVYAQSPFLSGRPFLISSICSYTLLRCLEIGLKISSRYKRIEFRSPFAFQSYQFVVRVTNQCSNQCSDITTFLSLTVFIFHKQFVVFFCLQGGFSRFTRISKATFFTSYEIISPLAPRYMEDSIDSKFLSWNLFKLFIIRLTVVF